LEKPVKEIYLTYKHYLSNCQNLIIKRLPVDENLTTTCGREQEIIEAAQQVFTEYGYKKATMDDVAAKMNITRSALYYYYKNKDELFISVGEYEFRKYEMEIKHVVALAKTTDERFTAFCRCYLPSRKKFRDVYKLDSSDFPFPFTTHKKLRSMTIGIHSNLITGILQNDRKIGHLENLEYYSTLLVHSIRGIVFTSHDDAPIEQIENDFLELCRVFCDGLRLRAGSNKK